MRSRARARRASTRSTAAGRANDTFAVPTHADLVVANASRTSPAFLFMVDDAPLQRKLGIYAEFAVAEVTRAFGRGPNVR